MRRALACVLLAGLGQPALADASGRATVEGAPVSWGAASDDLALALGVAPPLSLIMFTFSPQVASAAVSDEEWAREAARQGTDVRTIRIILGSSVYVTEEGNLASCTMFTIEAGTCGAVEILSIEGRAAAARSILEQTGQCRWTGFDPALHDRAAYRAGAESATLWIAADCR